MKKEKKEEREKKGKEVILAWNGPKIQHADGLNKDTIDTMHGAGKWHFVHSSAASKLKFYHVSKAVDT